MTEFYIDGIPEELRQRPQWICWAAKERNGKQTKIPKRPDGKGNAKSNDMATWGSFEQAVKTAEERGWGIGFVFSDAGPYVGIDLDDCQDAPGKPRQWLKDVSISPMARETFIEHSPSGQGLHIFLKDVSIPQWWTNVDRDTEDGHEGVEVYEDGRFFTVTGDVTSVSADRVLPGFDLSSWLRDAWNEFREDDPVQNNGTESSEPGEFNDDIEVDVHDILLASQYPTGERKSHPVHGSDTGSNFLVDEGAETWRCWRHGCTGNALHLVGMQEGIISCGEWNNGGLSSDTWSGIFEAARERGLPVGEKKPQKPKSGAEEARERTQQTEQAQTDGGSAAATGGGSSTYTPPSIDQRISRDVLTPLNPPEDWEGEPIDLEVAVDRVANIMCDVHDFVRPRSDVRGWRDTLYNYVGEEGIYEPHGEAFIANEAERLLGAVANNQRVREITKKIERRSLSFNDELQTPPNRIAVGNGILDLHSGELEEHTPDEKHRVKIAVDYNPDAECPRIDEFFHEIVADRDVQTLYRLVAHTIYREYVTGKAAMLLGEGQNGKSVFLSLVEEFLGQFNVSHRALQDFDNNDFAANSLEGKLANIHPDMGDESVRDLGTFKKLTGQDTLTADVKYESPITFENHATLLFAANRMPVLQEDTHALWRRWIYINFPYRFDDNDPDAKAETPKRVLMRELTKEEELEGLLARCVEEIREWWTGREWYPATPEPEEVRKKMKRASEPIFDFATVCLKEAEEEDQYLRKEDVRRAYREYAREESLPARSDNVFGEKLLNLRDFTIEEGRRRIDGKRTRVYEGITWSSRGRQVMGLDKPNDEDQSGLDETDKGPQWRAERVVRVLEGEVNPVEKAAIAARLAKRYDIEPEKGLSAISYAKERGMIQEHGNGYLSS